MKREYHNRFEFLDFLRFVAASAVIGQHVFEKLYPGFLYFSTYYFQSGVFGVTLFFLCSGFIIPVSLERQQSLKKFWQSRFFRLVPLYYMSLFSTLAFIHWGVFKLDMPSLKIVLVNMTMLQRFLGQRSVLGPYWTLSLEMAFYIMVSILFAFRMLSKTVANAVGALIICLLLGGVAAGVFHTFTKGWGTVFNLATMFVGSVYFKYAVKRVSKRQLFLVLALALFTLVSITYFNLFGKDRPEDMGTLSFVPVTTSLIASYLVFTLVFLFRDRSYNKVLLQLGIISYSLYLVQGSVIDAIPVVKNHHPLTALLWISVTFAISFVTYHLIEKPFIAIGRRLNKKVSTAEHAPGINPVSTF